MSALHVRFRVAESEYIVPAAEVMHLETFSGASPVPGTRSDVIGLVQVRGRVLPLIDLRRRFGLPSAPATLDSRVLVVGIDDRVIGLLVDQAREVLRVAEGEVGPMPESVGEAAVWTRGIVQRKDRLLLLLDLRKVVEDQRTREETTHGQ